MKNCTKIFVLFGPAGVGKSTVVEKVSQMTGGQICKIITHTTRPPRVGEVDGKDYIFTTREQFQTLLGCGEMVEWTEFNNNLYGICRSSLERANSKTFILATDTCGIITLKRCFGDQLFVVQIFVNSPVELSHRLASRNLSVEEIQKRHEADKFQLENLLNAGIRVDLKLENSELQECCENLLRFISNPQHAKV